MNADGGVNKNENRGDMSVRNCMEKIYAGITACEGD